MGIHTFNTLVLHNRPPQWLGIVVTATGWATAVIIGLSYIYPCSFLSLRYAYLPGVAPVSVTSNVNGPFYSIDGLTCDISKSYAVAHMFLYFLPVRLPHLGRSSCSYDSESCSLRGSSRRSSIPSSS